MVKDIAMVKIAALRPFCVALLASLSSIGAAAVNAETFQFLVKAKDGLQLSITGFGSNGKKTFEGMATKRVNVFGKASYSIVVDRDVVFASFGAWCVQDTNKMWSLPATYGKQAGEALCDRDPHDDGKGTYEFKVR